MATAIGRARSARAALISTLAIVAMAASAGGVAAAPPAQLTVDPASLDFGPVAVDTTSSAQTITLTAGRKDVVFELLKDNGDFVLAPTGTCELGGNVVPAGTSCTIDVSYLPMVAASSSGTITLDTCMKWETSVVTQLPHCLKVKDSVTVSLSGLGVDLS
jgi:hypothetical protein